jgi:hypothetical protein
LALIGVALLICSSIGDGAARVADSCRPVDHGPAHAEPTP